MLSFKVKYAIQALAELERAGAEGERLTVTELKHRCGFNPQGGFDSRGLSVAMSTLRRKRWIDNSNVRHYVVTDLTKATLYDLVMAIDEGLHMGPDIAIEGLPYKNMDKYAAAIELDGCLADEMAKRLKGIPLTHLFSCNESTELKLPVNVGNRAAGEKIVGGSVAFAMEY